MRLNVNNKGYKYITLYIEGKRKHFKLHRLLARLFKEDFTEECVVDHSD